MNEQDFAQRLVAEGLLTASQLDTCQEYQQSIGGRLMDIISKLGFVDEERLNNFVAQCEHMHTIDLSGRTVDAELMRRIPRAIIEKHGVLPFRQAHDVILLAMSEPMDFQAIEEIQFITSCKVETALAPRSQVRERIARFYTDHPDPDGTDEVDAEELGRRLVARIADPTVQALARTLLDSGLVDAQAWWDQTD